MIDRDHPLPAARQSAALGIASSSVYLVAVIDLGGRPIRYRV